MPTAFTRTRLPRAAGCLPWRRTTAALQELNHAVVVLSPLHAHLKVLRRLRCWQPDSTRSRGAAATSQLGLESVDGRPRTKVVFGGVEYPLQLWEYRLGGVRWLLFEAAGFFEADGGPHRNNPYVDSGSASQLARDSLFAAAAVPQVLAASESPTTLWSIRRIGNLPRRL